MVDSCFSVGVFCVCGALIAVILKQYCAEHSLAVSIAVSASVMIAAIVLLETPLAELRAMMTSAGISEGYINIIFKAVAICCITHISAQLCRDCGEGAMGAAAELWGRAALAAISLPVLGEFLSLMDRLM